MIGVSVYSSQDFVHWTYEGEKDRLVMPNLSILMLNDDDNDFTILSHAILCTEQLHVLTKHDKCSETSKYDLACKLHMHKRTMQTIPLAV